MFAAVFLILIAVYLVCGLFFAIPFVLVGVNRIDSHAVHGSWGFRLLILPGMVALWPLLLKRWVSGCNCPLEERNAHRLSASGHNEATNATKS
jgi:hypothetical protein